MTNLDRVLKSRDITLLTKVCVVKTMIFPEYSLEGLMLKLKLQYFSRLMQKANSLEKTLILERLRARGKGDDRG